MALAKELVERLWVASALIEAAQKTDEPREWGAFLNRANEEINEVLAKAQEKIKVEKMNYSKALDWAIDRAHDAERDDVVLELGALAEYVQEAKLDEEYEEE
jgi:hypothetical protein